MESKSYVCVKCGRVCHFCLHSKVEATEQLCSQCYIDERCEKEPFNSVRQNEMPDDVRKVAPKDFPNLTDLIRDEARKRAIRNECNGILNHNSAKPLQSDIEERYDAIPQEALRAVARVMGHGTRKYGPKNWDKIGCEDHLNHALRHINLALLDDTEDEPGTKAHLSHAICRLFFAYETYKEVSE